jgi:beta-N-acetylhexosaminidase
MPSPFPRGESALSFATRSDEEGLISQVRHQCFVAKGLGINCMLAPVADILTREPNPALLDRCFGRDAVTVTHYATMVYRTLCSEKMLSCAKHFPGHGNTINDTHVEFATSDVPLDVLRNREWKPFKNLIDRGIPFIMTAHVILPQIDSQRPATLSPTILQNYLRKELGFNGLIISDDLRMNAVAQYYNDQASRAQEASATEDLDTVEQDDSYLRQAAIDALEAGCDVLLSCQSIVREQFIYQAISDRMEKNSEFYDLMCDKAYRIYTVLAVGLGGS